MSHVPNNRFRNKVTINGLSVGNNAVFQTEDNRGRFVVERIRAIAKTLTGTGTLPIVNVGWTASNYTDLISGYTLLQTTVNASELMTLITNYTSIPASTVVYVRVATAGAVYTVISYDVYVEGYYEL